MTATPFYTDDLVTIFHGDCRDDAFAAVLADADVLVTDPPYGIDWTGAGYNGGQAGSQIANDEDTNARDDVLAVWGDRPALVFGSPLRPFPDGTKQVLVWQKAADTGMLGAINGWRRDWEAVFVLGRWPNLPACRSSVVKGGGMGYREVKATKHPHTKPVSVMRDLIAACPPGVILDPFMGSGSTLVAAQQLGRECIGFDVEAKWCTMARDRLAHLPLFLADAEAEAVS